MMIMIKSESDLVAANTQMTVNHVTVELSKDGSTALRNHYHLLLNIITVKNLLRDKKVYILNQKVFNKRYHSEI